MKRSTGFYSFILTSIACMLTMSANAASSVRMLGTNGKTVVGANSTNSSGVKTSAVGQTARASSLRFTPKSVSVGNIKSASGGAAKPSGGSVVLDSSPSGARLSIGQYFSNKNIVSGGTTGTGQTSGGSSVAGGAASSAAVSADLAALSEQLQGLQNEINDLKNNPQGSMALEGGQYIDISGDGNNVVSIDIAALQEDLRTALSTEKPIMTRIDSDYKLSWCYSDAEKTACTSDENPLIDLGQVLDDYDLASNNSSLQSLKDALDGKQGMLSEADNGFITINKQVGTIGVNFNELQEALGISEKKTSEIRFTEDGKLQWRYMDDYEDDEVTKKWQTADINGLLQQSLDNYVQKATLDNYVQTSALADLQGVLTTDANGYLKIENNQINVKFSELKNALNIPDKIEMEIASDGKLQWRYMDDFEQDGVTKKWTKTSQNINDLIDNKLVDFVPNTKLSELQGKLTTDEDGYVTLDNNKINLKLTELRAALQIPEATVEMEITENGNLQWRYTDEVGANGAEIWHDAGSIKNLVDGKLASYVSNESLNERLQSYITGTDLSSELATSLQDYADKTYLNEQLENKQVKLTEADNGFIAITPMDGSDKIGLKFNDLKDALGIDRLKTSEMRVDNGVLQWRYKDEYLTDGSGQVIKDSNGNDVKKWTNVYNLTSLLDGYAKEADVMDVVLRIDSDLAGKQVKLTPAEDGYIVLNEETGEIGVNMADLKAQLDEKLVGLKTSEMRVDNKNLQWRYTDEDEWHTLDLTSIELPYVKSSYLTNNYYDKTYINLLANSIETKINTSLQNISTFVDIPESTGLYLLSVANDGGEKASVWQSVHIIDGEGNVH